MFVIGSPLSQESSSAHELLVECVVNKLVKVDVDIDVDVEVGIDVDVEVDIDVDVEVDVVIVVEVTKNDNLFDF
tara:strand:- start:194 stop:415 length:222 start_codon:yes stop_codon:yes gene_type:complete